MIARAAVTSSGDVACVSRVERFEAEEEDEVIDGGGGGVGCYPMETRRYDQEWPVPHHRSPHPSGHALALWQAP